MINLLKFLIILFILIRILNPLIENINSKKKEITFLKNNIQRYKNYINKKNKIDELYKKSIKIYEINKKYFFTGSPSIIYTSLQKIIKQNANFNFEYIKWNNSVKKDNIEIYPITLKFSTTPNKFGEFIKKICNNKKLLIIKNLKINAINPNKISYTITIYGYKLKGKNK